MATTRSHLTIAEVLAMTTEDWRIECLRLEIPASGLDKSAIQRQLLEHIVAMAASTPASQPRAPTDYAAVNPNPAGLDQEGFIREEPNLKRRRLSPRTMTFRTPCTLHLASEILFSILGMSRILPLPTRAQE